MSRGGSSFHRHRRLRDQARSDALTGLDGPDRLRAALDDVYAIHPEHQRPADLVMVNNGGRAPCVIDARRVGGDWIVEGLIPAGSLAAVADEDDGTAAQVLAQGYDVVIFLHTRGQTDGPVLIETLWREGLVPGRRPPEPFWAEPSALGFVRCDTDEAA